MRLLRVVALLGLGACASTHGGGGSPGDDDFAPFADAGDLADGAGQGDACVPDWHDLLLDPAFDTDNTPWLQEPVVVATGMTPAADTPPNAAYMAGGSSQVQELSQLVSVPADASRLRVTGKIFISTSEDNTQSVAYDRLDLELFDEAGTRLEHLGQTPTFSNLSVNDAFTPFEFEFAMPHPGSKVRMAFLAKTDPSIATSFVLDSLTVDAFSCGP